jgi:hypothetical protein
MAKMGILPVFPDMFTMQGQKALDEMDFPGPYGLRVESLRDLLEIYDRELVLVEATLAGSSRITPDTGPSRRCTGWG